MGAGGKKRLSGYVREFAGRQNIREFDPLVRMSFVVQGMDGKLLHRRDLTVDNGLRSGAGE